ncbi:hypothetical protein FA15DRAFT_670400 [Coprinopsis marcescibilis]|uniref:Uncharacterized protein n=1 Tax=Coprinopsis marcescibilis TaxID=230819 RepID=A0A5C3KT14_COPMA|nr:hypothetical protein FA15DRAFT_670400 [Coprinopsis marcescibilis]
MCSHVLWLFLLVASFVYSATALRNVTVDDDSERIAYRPPGAWFMSDNHTLDHGYAHMLTQTPNASATFNFTGVAIYFLSPLWPYLVTTAISLDSGPVTLVNLVDRSRPDTGGFGEETVQSRVIWSAINLNNTQHTLRMSVGASQPFAVVDGLIYTELGESGLEDPAGGGGGGGSGNGSSQVETSTPSLPTAPPGPPPPEDPAKARNTRIAVGTALGFLGALIISLFVWFCVRRKRASRPLSEAWTIASGTSRATFLPKAKEAGSSLAANGGLSNGLKKADWERDGSSRVSPTMSRSTHTDQTVWQSPRLGYVGIPSPLASPASAASRSAIYSAAGYPAGVRESDNYDFRSTTTSPSPYVPGSTLATIVENSPVSTPSGGEERATEYISAARGARPAMTPSDATSHTLASSSTSAMNVSGHLPPKPGYF